MSQLLGQGKSKATPTPNLFLHPSPAASHASLPGIMAAGPGMPGALSSQQQQLHQSSLSTAAPGIAPPPTVTADPLKMASSARRKDGPTTTAAIAGSSATPGINLNIPLKLSRGESTRATDRTDALWAEMQATLEEVELSAGGGTRVFGPDHDRKLGELRLAQIALAQAWARSEADDAIETGVVGNTKVSAAGATTDGAVTDATGKTDAGAAAATGTDAGGGGRSSGTGSARPGSSSPGVGSGGQETDHDILLARKRREANDRYFQRVNQGVLDVVAKLEEVAIAMRAVEQESKEFVWGDGDNESAPQSAKS